MRYIWKGTISFGLINIPVGLYPAAKDHELKFRLLHTKDLSEIRYARICKEEDKEIPYAQIVKGIEKNGHYVVLSEEDFKRAEGEKTKTIEIIAFCDENEVDSVYYESPYYLKAEKGGSKAYYLLQMALEKSHKIAIVRFTLRNRSHIAAIKPYKHILLLDQMRFHSQILSIADLKISEKVRVTAQELEMAEKLIDQLSEPFVATKFHDTYIKDLEQAIKKKAPAGKAKTSKKTKSEEKELAQVYDLMTLLKASLKDKKPRAKKAQAG